MSVVIPDNYSLWEAHDTDQERQLSKLPECADCGEPIQQDTAVYMGGVWYCDSCIDAYRRDVNEE